MKIVVTGASGILSTTLRSLDSSIIFLSSTDYDIKNVNIIDKLIDINPDIILHAGAITDSYTVSREKKLAIQTNIVGTAHLASYCLDYHKRLVYISTDYVYDGKRGNHKEVDAVYPYNNYAWTKLGGECSVRMVTDHVIIRTSFGSSLFPYSKAFDNLITSKDYVDIIAPKILTVAKSTFIGIINIGTEAKSVFDYASRRNNVEKDVLPTQMNFSLNLSLYDQTFSTQ